MTIPCRIQEEQEQNPELWERVTYEEHLEESVTALADFVHAEPDDLLFVESTIRGEDFIVCPKIKFCCLNQENASCATNRSGTILHSQNE